MFVITALKVFMMIAYGLPGYIFVKTAGNGNYCNLKIDGFSQISTGGNFSNYHEADTTSYHIGKGSVASWSGNCSVWFIPCQGV